MEQMLIFVECLPFILTFINQTRALSQVNKIIRTLILSNTKSITFRSELAKYLQYDGNDNLLQQNYDSFKNYVLQLKNIRILCVRFENANIFKNTEMIYNIGTMKLLEELDVASNSMTGDDIGKLLDITKSLKKLRSIDLARNNISSIFGLKGLKQHKSLRYLNLNNTLLRDDSFVSYFPDNLEELDLGQNNLNLRELTLHLPKLKRLKSLKLDKINISYFAAERLARAFLEMPHLEKLDLSSNNLGEKSLEILIPSIEKLLNLEELNLSNIQINNFDSRFLLKLCKLKTFNFTRNNLDLDLNKESAKLLRQVIANSQIKLIL
jgi:hypothetical protein